MQRSPPGIERIVSGGQTGVDRAALDVAMALNIGHGGWCPSGRRAEDGTIPGRYQLRETASPDYAPRTEANVVDSDGTLILGRGPLTGGTALTADLARRHQKPLLIVDIAQPVKPEHLREWLTTARISILNVAGPRESTCPGIYEEAGEFLRRELESIAAA